VRQQLQQQVREQVRHPRASNSPGAKRTGEHPATSEADAARSGEDAVETGGQAVKIRREAVDTRRSAAHKLTPPPQTQQLPNCNFPSPPLNSAMHIIYLLLAAAAGAAISLQAAANASLRTNLNDVRWATFFSITGTIVTAAVVMIALRPAFPSATVLRAAPWWNWIGGPLGALIVLSGAALAPKLGAASFIAAIVAGQLACSILLDHFAWMNLPQHLLTFPRIIGACLIFAGVLLVTRR
jgi:transporter family-2 protein